VSQLAPQILAALKAEDTPVSARVRP